MPESVLVVANKLIEPFIPGPAPCLITEKSEEIYSLIKTGHTFIPRSEAENDYTRKQPIPYVAVRHGSSYMVLHRTTNQTEKRLHNKRSLGIGGHINPDEIGHGDIILSALQRELDEEVHINRPTGLRFIGIINDESNSVSRVHLGLLFVLDSEDGLFEVREKDMMSADWVDRADLDIYYESFETWSRIVADRYIFDREPLVIPKESGR